MTIRMEDKVLAIIPARASRDDVENLNTRELGGKPLIHYTIRAACQSKRISRVLVSTEDQTIGKTAVQLGAEVPFLRRERFSDDNEYTLTDIAADVVDRLIAEEDESYDIVVLLLPNFPFKDPNDIDGMVDTLIDGRFDSVIPLRRRSDFFWKIEDNRLVPNNFQTRKRRSDNEPVYEESGGIYIYRKDVLYEKNGLRLGKNIGHYFIGQHQTQVIHTIYDLFNLERLVRLPIELINEIIEHE
jgi:CMP-N,N'-diacetyllegionaminic acid synthase